MTNKLFEQFDKHEGRLIYKWENYFDVYEKNFSKFMNSSKPIVIVEIGILHGGSLQMWKKYFGPNAIIFGIDIYEECKKFEEEGIKIRIGSQADPNFLEKLLKEIPQIDILIDDGSHRMNHQIKSFKKLFDHITEGGVYLVEDTHSSYWNEFGGGLKRNGTFIEFTFRLVDSIHAWYSEQKIFKIDKYTRSIGSIHYYDSIVVIEKALKREKPNTLTRGEDFVQRESRYSSQKKTFIYKLAYFLLLSINKVLQFFKIRAIILNG